MEQMRIRFYEQIEELDCKKKANSTILTQAKYNELITDLKSYENMKPKPNRFYHLQKRYQYITVGGIDKLIRPNKSDESSIIYHVPLEEVFEVLNTAHISTGHGGRT